MPLVRFQVRNEYGLGQPELYSQADKEDPKAVLDGVAVAGLVGILRQLGDLAEFASEVFHGLQEQVMTTASRSHKLMIRVQHIEAALPPLEKVVLAQTSHIHFAYTTGSEWHPRIRNQRNHFVYNDLPRCIMDSYEECRDPPRLHLLDKFDTGGPGSCLKRYSDPTFFKRASATSNEVNADKIQKDRKARRSKKKRSSKQNGNVSRGASISDSRNSSMRFVPPVVDGRSSTSQTASTVDMPLKYDTGDHFHSFDSRADSGYIECVFHPSSSMQEEQEESKESPSFKLAEHNNTIDSEFPDECIGLVDDNFPMSSLQEQVTSGSSCVTWDEKAEIMEPKGLENGVDDIRDMHPTKSDIDARGSGAANVRILDQIEIFGDEDIHESISGRNEIEEVKNEPDNYVEPTSPESSAEVIVDMHATKSDIDAHEFIAEDVKIPEQMEVLADDNIHESISSRNQIDDVESEPDNYMDALNTIESESESDLDIQTKRELERSASIASNEGTDGILDLNVHLPDHHSPTFEYQTSPDHSSNKELPSDLPITISSESCELPSDLPNTTSVESFELPSDLPNTLSAESCELPSDLPNTISSESCDPEQISPSCISTNEQVSSDLPNSVSLDSHTYEKTSQIAEESSTDHSAGMTKSSDILNDSKSESLVGDTSSCVTSTTGVQVPSVNLTVSTFCKPEVSPGDMSSNSPVKFWTNGGLLGLEPSKPPDFAMSSGVIQNSTNMSEAEKVGSLTLTPKDEVRGFNVSAENSVCSEKDCSSKCSTSCLADKEDVIFNAKTSQDFSSSYLDIRHQSTGEFNMHNGLSNAIGNDLKGTSVLGAGTVFPVVPDVKSSSTEANQESHENSSLVLGLTRRLSNGFGRKVSSMHNDTSEPASSVNNSVLEQRTENHTDEHNKLPETAFEEQFVRRFAADSPTASPPLEHMKISFHPIDSFETSKLQLKFSDGAQSHESIRDMFPSFQLIPEPSVPLHDYGSDSDDDTFCRSSPNMSDDCLSRHSESNSEQWECGETLGGRDPELYDALCGISSMERISSSLELGEITNSGIYFDGGSKSANSGNCVEPSTPDPMLELPIFDAVKPTFQQDTKDDSDLKNPLSSRSTGHSTPAPPPPPLPPAQWRVSTPHVDETKDKPDTASEDFKNVFGARILGSSTFQLPRLAPVEQQPNKEPTVKPKTKPQDNGQKKENHALNGKGMDEREDFLQQIRAKSRNLKHTVTPKSTTTTTGPAANVKVTAILEKANAIRQAVGSDDGEDDYWSDM
ncbi:hypothetical protein UlMin_016931 [Ulmus minor]